MYTDILLNIILQNVQKSILVHVEENGIIE